MKHSALLIAATGLMLVPGISGATGIYTCDSGDRSTWKSMQMLETKVKAEGWQVRRIKEDGGCYELYGTTPEGDRVEAYFHPVTLEKHLVARRGQILFRKEN